MKLKRSLGTNNAGLLLARLLIATLFFRFGIIKGGNFQATIRLMHALHTPLPELAAAIAVLCGVGGGLLIAFGFQTRLVALVMIVYTSGATYFAHRFWLMSGAAMMANQINFFKNMAICGGFLILASVGPGKYSVDRG